MATTPRITLEQWRALQTVVEAAGYAQAAAALHKSQSTVTYAVQKIQSLLGVKVFEIRGRKAVLTEAGQVLYRRARTLLEEAAALERGAEEMAADWQPEIRIAVEVIFPTWLLLECLREFAAERPETRIELYETVLGGTDEALQSRAWTSPSAQPAAGFPGDCCSGPLHRLRAPRPSAAPARTRAHRARPAAAPPHLHPRHRHPSHPAGRLTGAELRWTVSHKATSIRAAAMGLGFAWYPAETSAKSSTPGGSSRCRCRRARSAGRTSISCSRTRTTRAGTSGGSPRSSARRSREHVRAQRGRRDG